MVYRLASPSRVQDASWIRPGKVAWDWWNDWNISHVDFRAGINTATYRYYADFASANHIEYMLLDEGWSNDRDIMQIVPGIDLQGIIDYAKQKNVGVWLWMGSYPLDQKMEEAFSKYSQMGVKGLRSISWTVMIRTWCSIIIVWEKRQRLITSWSIFMALTNPPVCNALIPT
jgi:alpha-glucosidase